jgi:hypothetical protein
MVTCVYCGSEASLRFNNVPVCLECDALGNAPEGLGLDEQSVAPGKVLLRYNDRERSAPG